jgi:hypothetical protein
MAHLLRPEKSTGTRMLYNFPGIDVRFRFTD